MKNLDLLSVFWKFEHVNITGCAMYYIIQKSWYAKIIKIKVLFMPKIRAQKWQKNGGKKYYSWINNNT